MMSGKMANKTFNELMADFYKAKGIPVDPYLKQQLEVEQQVAASQQRNLDFLNSLGNGQQNMNALQQINAEQILNTAARTGRPAGGGRVPPPPSPSSPSNAGSPNSKGKKGDDNFMKKTVIGGVAGVFVLIALMFFSSMYAKVPPGNVGIVVNNLGSPKGVVGKEVGVGYVWLGLFKNIYLFPTFQQNYTWTRSPHEGKAIDESITFQISQGLEVNADFGISFKIDPDKTSTLFQTYRKGIEEITHVYVRNTVRDAVNKVASQMTAEEVYGSGKVKLLSEVTSKVRDELKDVGLIVDNVYLIGSFRFPELFVQALNAKLEAQQRAEQRANEVAEAQAQAKKDVAQAEGTAKAMLTKATAEAQANKLKLQTLTPELIQYEAIQKWNGQLPSVSSGVVPFINMDLTKKAAPKKDEE